MSYTPEEREHLIEYIEQMEIRTKRYEAAPMTPFTAHPCPPLTPEQKQEQEAYIEKWNLPF